MKRKTGNEDEIEEIEEIEETEETEGEDEDEDEDEEEVEIKWAKHYASCHLILLVGDGDFSFSLSLANTFGSAMNIVATSLDSEAKLFKKYQNASKNLRRLDQMGATIVHEVDARNMRRHPNLRRRKFDRIIYNYPHAGFKGPEDSPKMIKKHQDLVRSFFENARHMLSARGEVHITHRDSNPYKEWKIQDLATSSKLEFVGKVPFTRSDYPGYHVKRGDGGWSHKTFRIRNSFTFKFKALE